MSETIRMLFLISTNVIYENIFLMHFFRRRRPLNMLLLVALSRVVLYNCLIATYLPLVTHNASWLMPLRFNVEVLYVIALLAVLYYTYGVDDTDVLKIYLAFAISEVMMSGLLSIVLYVVNVLAHRPDLTNIIAPFQPLDLLVPVIEGCLVYIIIKAYRRFFHAYQDYEIRHRRLIAIFLVIFITYGFYHALFKSIAGGTIVNAFLFILLLFFLFITLMLNAHIQNKHQALMLSQALMNAHFTEIQETMMDMDLQRREIDVKMADLMAHDFPADLTQAYITDMKAREQHLYHTLFTDFYMLDALLSSKAKDYDDQEISYDFKITASDLGGVSQLTLCQILQVLFQYGEEEGTDEVALQLAMVKNMLVMSMSYRFMPVLKEVLKKLKKLHMPYHYEVIVENHTLMVSLDTISHVRRERYAV